MTSDVPADGGADVPLVAWRDDKMKCVQHSDHDVVGTCLVCGGGLCPACFERYASPPCTSHGVAQQAAGQRSIRRGLLIVGILAAFGFLLGIAHGLGTGLLDAYILGAT